MQITAGLARLCEPRLPVEIDCARTGLAAQVAGGWGNQRPRRMVAGA